MATLRLTAAQALVGYLAAQSIIIDGREVALFGGVWAIFGHGNVAGLGEALYHYRNQIQTFRSHNEQAMTHAAVAFAKAHDRRRMMACTTSIGPGALNMVTAAALAHVNRLPVLLLPGDVFASRRPDPVLQQIEGFADATISANDCFRPVSRYFDRIMRAEQLLDALPRALAILTDPVDCGPVTLALCQDVQAEAFDYPEAFFDPRCRRIRTPEPDAAELANAARILSQATRPLIIAGDDVPVAETQAGKGALAFDRPQNCGAIGVTGAAAANALARDADVILAIGTRLQDFTTGSRALFARDGRIILHLNVAARDAEKHGGIPLVADAARGLAALGRVLGAWRAPAAWADRASAARRSWSEACETLTAPTGAALPSDAQVIGAVDRVLGNECTIVCAAGGLPGELHKLWRARGDAPVAGSGSRYHVEYGFSCMGYEIAGGLGVKQAHPDRTVVVMLGDGSYLMLNSEIATSVTMGLKLIIIVLDNRGFGCINRLQQATGGAPFNNLLMDSYHVAEAPIDFVAHAAALGAFAARATDIATLEICLAAARDAARTSVIVIDTDPMASTADGGAWWDVAVPEVSARPSVQAAWHDYDVATIKQKLV
ncbi:MAG: 3D-(3,5/4)-trihydroxycyclohexane-1,2-dione acylhydrolase (decyclizing) [Acidiphilium sp. 37-64-53]|uniref:3D-(3,5/4)-trihydroxycyclohexane-1,2-dione acylhydrolase (decyclizing) n=1 Tax=Acidiphilium sp. 37-64-53 TaxID=1970299 RepID=UPI000BC89F66|nr:3D-(3,5/4)-trihydroxycyclohexane-1,2-dione acylhydrolase (decyclizing) [Acidiphilium sp. 37-64-53]OYW00208.1 MAG: 3D-(3,5/4)-trihydroxycyclohexane-1,2-dione acylhydrolase (decyclizing) [Acidiphilium sp. 37-64-53]